MRALVVGNGGAMKFGLPYEIALPRQVAASGKDESDADWEAIEPIRFAEEPGLTPRNG